MFLSTHTATTDIYTLSLHGRSSDLSVINLLDPDVIVLGGGMSNIERLYTEVPRRWARHVFSDQVATRLVRNAHGDSDRKSTRLNSSHRCISYAVFCLKKKKKKRRSK